jgi:hypothetical protein
MVGYTAKKCSLAHEAEMVEAVQPLTEAFPLS